MLLHNNVSISLVIHISRQLYHMYVHLTYSKPMSRFIHQITYIVTIHFLLNQSYFHYYLLLCFYFDGIVIFKFKFMIALYFNI